ncbi:MULTISPECIES: MFS transporter [unclassified Isoptericola]|uniref:MFS transporter n=1 Tax=Isoptericola sp. NPDC057191 TaxID=3346041 RepID=UPI003645B4C5
MTASVMDEAPATSGTRQTAQMPLYRKVTYAFTDLSGNLLYCIISGYALYYFTEVYGLSIATAGAILLAARIIDAVDAPVWGFIIDHTRSRWGQSRPWFLWMAIPFPLTVWLLFTTPPIDGTGKAVYAAVVYILAGITYTGMSTPITSVLPNLTSNLQERTVANSFRMVGGNVGNFLAVTFVLPLVTFFGGSPTSQSGWSLTVGLYAIVAFVLLVVAFATMREKNVERATSISVRDSVRAARGNWPWVLLVVANVLFWVGLTARTTALPFYFQYNQGSTAAIALFNGVSIVQVAGMASVPLLVKRLGKYGSTILGFALAIVGQVGLALFAGDDVLLMASWVVACLGSGTACALFFAMVADTVDYGEWRNGVRAAGFLTAIGSSFCIKMGAGLGAFLPSVIMGAGGYVADQPQSATALAAIQFSFAWLPALAFALGIVPMLVYRRFERNEPVVLAALAERAEQPAPPADGTAPTSPETHR